MNNNMLIKVDERKSIFKKIREYLKSLFSKNNTEDSLNIDVKQTKNNNIIDDLKSEKEILDLQLAFESGKLLEENMSEEQKESLYSLYKKQIKTLEENLSMYKNELQMYKTKIMEAKKECLKS